MTGVFCKVDQTDKRPSPSSFARVPRPHIGACSQSSLGNKSRDSRSSLPISARIITASRDRSPWRKYGCAKPEGCPPPAPCTRQTRQPVTAGARQGWPVRLAVARHLGAALAWSMGLASPLPICPPPMLDMANNGLTAALDVHSFHPDDLLPFAAILFQCLHLGRIGPR